VRLGQELESTPQRLDTIGSPPNRDNPPCIISWVNAGNNLLTVVATPTM
jgi:hypothetical protein